MDITHQSEQPVASPRTEARHQPACTRVNVGNAERIASTAAGVAGVLLGLTRRGLGGMALAALGGSLIYRGLSGQCVCYRMLGINTAQRHSPAIGVRARHGYRLQHEVIVDRSPEDLYQFWRDLDNLSQAFDHLRSVEPIDDRRSHWVADVMGMTLEWDAEIHVDRENELIAWRSIPGGDVDSAGSIHFEPAPNEQGTLVSISLKYDPPGGKLGANIAALFGEGLEQQIQDDLHRFKERMEGVPGQPT